MPKRATIAFRAFVEKNRTSPIRPSVSRSDAMRRDRILVDTLGSLGSRNERRNLSGEPFPCHPGVVEVPLGAEVDGFLSEETVRSVSEIVPWLEEAKRISSRLRLTSNP